MNEQRVLSLLNKEGVIIMNDHIVYSSGRHGSSYFNKDAIYSHTKRISDLSRAIANKFTNDEIDIVIGPTIGGVIISQWTAHHLSRTRGKKILSLYVERKDDSFFIKKGYEKLISGKRVLIVDDVLTTGRSVKEIINIIEKRQGTVVGVGVLCNQGVSLENVPKLVSLINLDFCSWKKEDCPLCLLKIPINNIG